MDGIRIYPISEQAVTVEFGQEISSEVNDKVISLHQALQERPFPGFLESVPAFGSLTVFFNLRKLDGLFFKSADDPYEYLTGFLEDLIKIPVRPVSDGGFAIEIPVCYDISLAPDLQWVSEHCRLSIPDVIRAHTEMEYRVYMIGFVPGFPYLGLLPPELDVPRKRTPSLSIPAGSVALAGRQTGIYPFDIPGGWQVIGRTPVKLFERDRQPFCLLKAGMRVRFREISLSDFFEQSKI